MKSYWMWHWGDYEIYHTNLLNDRRQEYGADFPAMWHGDCTYPIIEFHNTIVSERDTDVTLAVCGKGYIVVDGKRNPSGKKIFLKAGEHKFVIRVSNYGGLPAAFLISEEIHSGAGWLCSHLTAEKNEAGWLPCYDDVNYSPQNFTFSYETVYPIAQKETKDEKDNLGVLYDFGKEMFGYVNISGLNAEKTYRVVYGESEQESLALEDAIIFEYVKGCSTVKLTQRAFRYIFVTGAKMNDIKLNAEYEYLPFEQRGSFRCDNEIINRIWEMCRYTFHLNCREAYIDGIKRDHWIWSGDSYQSYLINKYLFMDREIDKRTIIGLRGKDPVEQHLNTILDYSMYWIISIYDYYMTYGDVDLLNRIYPKLLTMYNFIKTRENSNGFLEGKDGDWTFIDWSDIDKTGAVAAEQMLYVKTKQSMAKISSVLGIIDFDYEKEANELLSQVNKFYWDDEKGAFIDSYESGKRNVTRHANIFAILFNLVTDKQMEKITENVLLSDSVTKITTPYFEGFELDVMCQIGELEFFENMLLSYWGKMLELGATTVWEEFNPNQTGAEHYSMYKKRFGKSLCHAWGATPIYLLGRYYLGVYPTSPGYKTFTVKPNLGGLNEIEGTVPVGAGEVYIHMTKNELTVRTNVSGGTLCLYGKEHTLTSEKEFFIKFD